MTTKCRSGTYKSQELDRELSNVLMAISVVSKRLADKVAILSEEEKNMEGGNPNGKSQRIVSIRR